MRLPEVLPQLTGRWLLAYRVLWVSLMLLALGERLDALEAAVVRMRPAS